MGAASHASACPEVAAVKIAAISTPRRQDEDSQYGPGSCMQASSSESVVVVPMLMRGLFGAMKDGES